jgi:ADP-ribose pyrophosphatase YjhB (NUDIX family)
MAEVSETTSSAQFRIAASALLFDEHRVLLIHRRDIDWWGLPGGGMELGETVEDTVKREVLEETGLEVEVEQLVGVYSKPQKQEVVLAFRCRKVGGVLTETEEARECCYFVPDNLPVNTLPKHRQRIQDALLEQECAVIRNQLSSTEEDQQLRSC